MEEALRAAAEDAGGDLTIEQVTKLHNEQVTYRQLEFTLMLQKRFPCSRLELFFTATTGRYVVDRLMCDNFPSPIGQMVSTVQ